MSIRGLLLLLVFALTARLAGAGDWPQWRGPDRSGVANETGLLKEWPADGPPLLWKVEGLGTGFSPVSVQGGRLYTVAFRGDDEVAIALDRGTGKEVWATRLGPAAKESPSMRQLSQRAPTVDSERLYATTPVGDLVCLETDRGRELWRKNYPTDFAGQRTRWGYCDYPLVDGDRLIVTPGGSTATLAALNKRTGEVIWKAAVAEDEEADYSPAVVVEVGGVRQYVQSLAGGLAGVAAKDGRLLWRYTKTANQIIHTIAPVVRGDLVYCAGAYGTRSVLLKLVPDGTGTRADEVYVGGGRVWNWHSGPVLTGDYLYAGNMRELLCLELQTGKVAWADRGPGGSPSVVAADGRLYFRCTGGVVRLVEPTPKGYVERGSLRIPSASADAGPWSAPVVAGGRLFLRDQGDLYCYDLRSNAPRPADAARPAARPRPIKRPDTVFVPTPHDVVDKMLDLAAVKKTDVVYDLGCGDGRIVIAAAQKYGCKAVGVELDPECVKAARQAVRDAKVEDLVRIDEGDLFKADLADPDVVALYLLPSMNEKLIPQLEKMKPGSRVVAHALGIPGVTPDKVVSLVSTEDGLERKLYLWTVPLRKAPSKP
jgi:outer membrane protein assembly factor BamB/precorrin-6B methylase 2